MPDHDSQLSDEDLVLLADGETGARQAVHAHAHLAACWDCRTRMADLESAIGAFVHAYHANLDPRVPPSAGPRALLKARLAQCTRASPVRWWQGIAAFLVSRPWQSYGCAVLLFGVVALAGSRYLGRGPTHLAAFSSGLVPNKSLTPGAIQSVEQTEICTAEDKDPAWLISAPVEQEAFEEYGVVNSRAKKYQLDYLIPPALGGTADIHNLWPQPYSEAGWNAHAKDELEDRLRQLVCEGRLSLPEAQRELATDWIGAYKNYFDASGPRPGL